MDFRDIMIRSRRRFRRRRCRRRRSRRRQVIEQAKIG